MIATPKYRLSMAGIPIVIGTLSGEAPLLCRHALNFPNHLNPAHPHFGEREPLSAQILESRPEAAGVFAVRVAVRDCENYFLKTLIPLPPSIILSIPRGRIADFSRLILEEFSLLVENGATAPAA